MDIKEILLFIWEVYATASAVLVTWFLIKLLFAVREVKQELAERAQESIQKVKFVYVEKHDDLVYLYDALTKTFIAQSDNLENLYDRAQERFPDVKLIEADILALDKQSN